jgi:opacity protein-like surface antigen
MRYAGVLIGLASLVGFSALPADAGETGWRVRGFGALLNPDTSEMTVNGDGDEILVEGEHGFGGGVGVEYQFHKFLGVEGGVVVAGPKITLSGNLPEVGSLSLSDTVRTTIFTGDALLHVTPGNPVLDLYLGAGIAAVAPGDLSYDILGIQQLNVRAENYVTWSARAGLDLALGADSPWAVSLGARYIPGDVELRQLDVQVDDATEEFGFNIWSFTAGVAYRF